MERSVSPGPLTPELGVANGFVRHITECWTILQLVAPPRTARRNLLPMIQSSFHVHGVETERAASGNNSGSGNECIGARRYEWLSVTPKVRA